MSYRYKIFYDIRKELFVWEVEYSQSEDSHFGLNYASGLAETYEEATAECFRLIENYGSYEESLTANARRIDGIDLVPGEIILFRGYYIKCVDYDSIAVATTNGQPIERKYKVFQHPSCLGKGMTWSGMRNITQAYEFINRKCSIDDGTYTPEPYASVDYEETKNDGENKIPIPPLYRRITNSN